MKDPFLLLNTADNVLVARRHVQAGTEISLGDNKLIIEQQIPLAHKIARETIEEGTVILKYGMPIGTATAHIAQGQHVHIHNIRSNYTPTHSLQDADGRSEVVTND